MFFHIFSYKIKEIVRMKWVIAWTLIFPLVLATAFYAGFGRLVKKDINSFEPVKVALVSEGDTPFSQMVKELSKESSDKDYQRMFVLTETDEKKAAKLLKNGKIKGIYTEKDGKDPVLEIADNGINETILAEFLRSYINHYSVVKDVVENEIKAASADGAPGGEALAEEPIGGEISTENAPGGEVSAEMQAGLAKIYEETSAELMNADYLSQVTFRKDPVSPYMQFFFSLLAMASLFSSWMAVVFMDGISANQSERGLRFECSPASKFTAVAAATLAGIIMEFFSNVLIVSYIEFVLGLKFGIPLGYVILVTTIGGAIGITSGIAISAFTSGHEAMKIVIPLSFTMVCSFLSGLMVSSMKQVVERHMPVLNRINPAAVFTDALYSAGTYGIGAQYWKDIIIMLIMIFIFMTVAAVKLSRRSYDSI